MTIGVLADAANVAGGALGAQQPLCHADRVQCRATSNVVDLVVVHKVLVHGNVLVLSQDGVVECDTIPVCTQQTISMCWVRPGGAWGVEKRVGGLLVKECLGHVG